jgi:hypothetical protein
VSLKLVGVNQAGYFLPRLHTFHNFLKALPVSVLGSILLKIVQPVKKLFNNTRSVVTYLFKRAMGQEYPRRIISLSAFSQALIGR